MTSSNYNYQYSIEQKLSYWIVFSVFDQYTTHFSVHPVSWKIVYELCQNNAPRKLWKFNIFIECSRLLSYRIFISLVWLWVRVYQLKACIYINTTAHTLITMGNHAFLYFKNKRKKKFLHVSNKIFELKTCSFSVQCRQMKKLCVFVHHKIKSVELPSQTTIFAHATTSKRE